MLSPEFKNFEEELTEFLETNQRKAPVFSGRVCRHCGGPTVETDARRRFIGWDSCTVPRVARYAGVVRRRFWCDPCERVTS